MFQSYSKITKVNQNIKGSKFSDRVFLNNKARLLLQKYVGMKDGRYPRNHPVICHAEFELLVSKLEHHQTLLADIIRDMGEFCSDPYRKLLELARSTPTCGTFQICGNEDIINLLELAIEGKIACASSCRGPE